MPSSGTSSFYCNDTELTVLRWDLHDSMDMPGGFRRAQSSWYHPSQLLHWFDLSQLPDKCVSQHVPANFPFWNQPSCPCSPAGSSHMSSSVWYPPSPSQSCPLACCMVSHTPLQLLPLLQPNEQKSSHIWYMCIPQAAVPKFPLVRRLLEKPDIKWVRTILSILQCFSDRAWVHAINCMNAAV